MLPVRLLVERGVLAQFLSASAMQPSKDCDEVPKEDKSILSASLVPSIIRRTRLLGLAGAMIMNGLSVTA